MNNMSCIYECKARLVELQHENRMVCLSRSAADLQIMQKDVVQGYSGSEVFPLWSDKC